MDAFELIKKGISEALVLGIDDKLPFVVETDASDHCIAAALNQSVGPVAFFSRTLSKSEKLPSSNRERSVRDCRRYSKMEAIPARPIFSPHYGSTLRILYVQQNDFMFNRKRRKEQKNSEMAG